MRILHLLRHVKSSWDDPSLDDRARPLSRRGRRAGALVAAHLAETGVRPGLVLCSPARRTRDTLALVIDALADPDVRYVEALYAASAEEILGVLGTVDPRVTELLVVGHNPGLQDVALEICAGGDRAAVGRLREKLPTGALVTVEIETAAWDALRGAGRLVSLVVPRDLLA